MRLSLQRRVQEDAPVHWLAFSCLAKHFLELDAHFVA